MQLKGQYFWQSSLERPMKIKKFSQEKGVVTCFELEEVPVGEEIKELILPSFLNLHCHLELGFLRGKLDKKQSFPEWVGQLRKYSEHRELEDYKYSVFQGVKDSLASGVSTILDVGNSKANLKFAKYSPIRIFSSLELIGLDPTKLEGLVQKSKSTMKSFAVGTDSKSSVGVSAHAPFSCSAELIEYVNQNNQNSEFPNTIHLSESLEEKQVFDSGEGKLAGFLSFIYPDWQFKHSSSTRFENSIDYMFENDLIQKGSVLVHVNHSNDSQLRKLKDLDCTIVHCPASREFFGHKEPDFLAWKKAGLNICLGTDSLASNESLNMWKELKLLFSNSEYSFKEVFEMATINGAKALNKIEFGVLEKNAFCDFQKVSFKSKVDVNSFLSALESQDFQVVETVVDGVTRWLRPQ
jgi:aminodeoxyfutalosine deaminase